MNNNWSIFRQPLFLYALLFCMGVLSQISKLGISNVLFYQGFFVATLAITELLHSVTKKRLFLIILGASYVVLQIILICVLVIHVENRYQFGPLTRDTVKAAFQSSNVEIWEYILQLYKESTAWYIIICFFSVPVLYIVLKVFYRKDCPLRITPYVWGILLIASSVSMYCGREDIALFLVEGKAYREVLAKYNPSRKDILKVTGLDKVSSSFDGNIIVLIGESTARHRMGIYGYFRETTRNLTRIKDDLYVFTDVISSDSYTTESLSDALTFGSRNNNRPLYDLPDIITVAKKAGFFTAWLSNQNAAGVWDDTPSAMGREADMLKFHDPASGKKFVRTVFDEQLVASLDKLLLERTDKKKLVFLHMMSTHFPYCDIIPDTYEDYAGGQFQVKMDASVFGGVIDWSKKDKTTRDTLSQ
jgi:heptose-I-phosphate ethanolaminephosphotransferase